MKRVVITGMGVVSCLGNNRNEVAASLREGRSGIRFNDSFAEIGMRSQISGTCDIDITKHLDRRTRRFAGDATAYALISMHEALDDAGLTTEEISHERIGVIAGSGTGSPKITVASCDTARARSVRKIGPFTIPQTMGSTVSAGISNHFKIRGVNYSITSACATSVHAIGAAVEQIQWGKQDMVFAGGAEELDWTFAIGFDAMGALSGKYNDTPETASRPYDETRDGFVISSGGGIVVLEAYEHAVARGARIRAEVVGYAANSDGFDMVAPSGEGAVRCMRLATGSVDAPIDYINTHGTSTPAGDIVELNAIREVFGDQAPAISSTKSLSGHSLGATGAHEVIYSLSMLENDFISASANITQPDPGTEGFDIVTKRRDAAGLRTVLTNSFGFGGTNACLVLQKI